MRRRGLMSRKNLKGQIASKSVAGGRRKPAQSRDRT
jgi:hypothetical protein